MSLTSTLAACLQSTRQVVRRHRKLAVVAAAILLPVFLLSAVVIHFCANDIAVAEQELTGTAYLRRAWSMVSACDARLPATEWNAVPFGPGVKQVARLDAMGQALQVEMARVPVQSETCTHGRIFLKQIADGTTLTLDPRQESYYLMTLAVADLPALSGRVAGLDRALEGDLRSAQARAALNFNAGLLRDALQAVTSSAADASRGADGVVQVATSLPLARLSESVQRGAEAADTASVDGEADGTLAHARSTIRDIRGATDGLWVVSVNQLDRLLAKRIAAARLTLWATLAGAAALTIAAIVVLVWYDLYTQREEVLQLNDSLRQSNEELERFAYICSHDMQEPVRMMSLYAEMLLEDASPRLDEADRRHVAFIVRNSHVIKSMISDILIFSRVGRDPIAFQPVNSDAILNDVLLELEPEIARRHAKIRFSDLPTLRTNPTLLRLLFQNLIGNALKFQLGARPPEIVVTATATTDKAWRFDVRDNGIGIDERYRDEVFAIFRRLHTRDEFPGNGIGLSTCRKFVNLVGGSIDFTSTPGKGTNFFFVLPEATGIKG